MKVNNYMAILRNLRNCLDENVSEERIKLLCDAISNKEAVKRSRQLPFRFLSAYRMIESNKSKYTAKTLDSLEVAMDTSCENLPKLPGSTFITADSSDSMRLKISDKSKVMRNDIANILLCIAHRISDFPITSIFADNHEVVQLSQRNGVLANLKILEQHDAGGSTNAYLVMQYLIQNKIKVDRIVMLSDMQCYDSYGTEGNLATDFKKYKATVNPNVYLYSVDLAGYGTLQIPQDEPNVCLLAGWSERILEFISLFEQDKKTAINRIKEWKYIEKSELEAS